jgi:undecaprenyl-diphosphatase
MTLLQSIIMGAMQGITEFLPISSSAHLIVLPWFFNIQDGSINKLTYDVMLHLGTLAAILCIYGKKFARVVTEGIVDFREGRSKESLLVKLLVASIPAALAGFFGQHIIETYLRTPFVAAYMLAFVSILMIFAERIHVEKSNISYPVATAIGIAQAAALVPGTSRSGATITMGMLLGLNRSEAVDFSFMLSIPIIFGTALYEMRHFQYHNGNMAIYVYGAISAFIFGAVSLSFLIRYLKRHPLDIFAYYRIVLALVILLASLQRN